ncbi:hypothetical protein UlMin_034436 [Ulmus minor]
MNGAGERRRDRSSVIQCSSPRRIFSRGLAALRRVRERRVLVRSQKRVEEVKEQSRGSSSTSRLVSVSNSSGSPNSVPEIDDSGRYRIDGSFNLGVACGLFYLVAASKNELNKMVEVRKQMELLLQNAKDELQRNGSPIKRIGSHENLAYYSNNDEEGSGSNTQISPPLDSTWTTSSVIPESESILACDDSSKLVMDEEEHRFAGMDELEAELEAEFERLQLHLDTEHSVNLPQQPRSKAVKDTYSSISYTSNSGEVIDIDPLEADSEIHTGVPPVELERKLHELLEARQLERIKELEDALKCAFHKLGEKELEVSWWKDTALLISRHIPEPGLVSQLDPQTFCSSG